MVRQSVDRTGSSMAESKLRKSPAASANERGEPRSEQAYRYIVEAIKEGSLRPGTRIREVDLAERTGLSRTPVREALNRLQMEGLVANDPDLHTLEWNYRARRCFASAGFRETKNVTRNGLNFVRMEITRPEGL